MCVGCWGQVLALAWGAEGMGLGKEAGGAVACVLKSKVNKGLLHWGKVQAVGGQELRSCAVLRFKLWVMQWAMLWALLR